MILVDAKHQQHRSRYGAAGVDANESMPGRPSSASALPCVSSGGYSRCGVDGTLTVGDTE